MTLTPPPVAITLPCRPLENNPKSSYTAVMRNHTSIDGRRWWVGRDVCAALGLKTFGGVLRRNVPAEETSLVTITADNGIKRNAKHITDVGVRCLMDRLAVFSWEGKQGVLAALKKRKKEIRPRNRKPLTRM